MKKTLILLLFITTFAASITWYLLIEKEKIHLATVEQFEADEEIQPFLLIDEWNDLIYYHQIFIHRSENRIEDQNNDSVYTYSIDVNVNEKFAELSNERQFEILELAVGYFNHQRVFEGTHHEGYYKTITFTYTDPYFYGDTDIWWQMDVHDANKLNNVLKEEWIHSDRYGQFISK